MAKSSGLSAAMYIGGHDVANDVSTVSIQGGPSPLDVTGLRKSAYERIGGRIDGSITATCFFNPEVAGTHLYLSTLPRTDSIVTYCHRETLGATAASEMALQIGYDGTRGNEGALTFNVESQSDGYGVEWGRLLTAGKRTDTGATAGSSVDFLVGSTTFGLQAYLHVFSFAGTDATIKLQQSSDDGGADAFADVVGGGFTAVTAGPTFQRIQTARGQTVEQYLRVVTTTSAGFTSLVFAVMVTRNDTAVNL